MTPRAAFWRRILVYALYIAVCSLLQVTLPDSAALLGASPDLTLVLAVLCGYMFGTGDGLVIGLAAGFMRDLLAGRTLGLGMLLLMYAGIASSVLLHRFFRRNILFGLVLVAFFTAAYAAVLVLLTYLVPPLPDVVYPIGELLERARQALPGQVLANLAAALPLIFLLALLGPYRRSGRGDEPDGTIMGDSLWRVA
ncbi:MAG: hypothetical protein GX821_10385, partial [Clostridiaceae bacterium]|nr:hypothetical protein [Clostridiales bacterium]NLB45553.1 hypothetical protein [Clostridiaceae bacterium]